MNPPFAIPIVIHASAPWETFHRRPLIEAMARRAGGRYRILVVDRPLDLVVAPLRHRGRLARWLSDPAWRVEEVTENLTVLRTFLPLHEHLACWIPPLYDLQERWLRARIARALPPAARRIDWIYYPEQLPHIGDEAFAVYECYDEYNADPRGAGPRREALESRLLERADLVVATSRSLLEARRARARHSHLLPNAVDYAALSAAQAAGDLPSEVARIPEPRIGFLGYLKDAVDTELLFRLMTREPGWSWVFLGPPDGIDPEGLARLRALPNAHFLGFVPPRDLARYLRGMRLGVIPFKTQGAYHQAINPLKLYQYMAAGLPVVSTDLPEVRPFSPPVRLAREPEAFMAELRDLVERDALWAEARAAGDAIARRETWDHRADDMLARLDARLEEAACRA